MYDDVLEEAAKLVYDSWAGSPGWLPWVPNGNSSKQDEARAVAARILRIHDRYANTPKVSDQCNCPLNRQQSVMRQLSL